jgi:hypothetical protein
LYNALGIPCTEILVMTKRNIWLITRHSSHHWILCLSSNMLHDEFSRLYWIPKTYSFWRKLLFINMANILTAIKEAIQSYWNKVYSHSSCNQMWILKYWIFWIIVIIVPFHKCSLSKHVSFLHFTDHSLWECIKTFQNITNNAVIFKMVRNVTN